MLIQDTNRVSRKACCAMLGISEQTFQKLKAAGVFIPLERGTYDLKEVIAAWVGYHLDGGTNRDLTEERRLLTIAQRKQIEQRMRAEERELVPLHEAQRAFNETMVLVASQLDGLPGRAAGEVAGLDDPAAVRDLLFTETRRIRDVAAAKLAAWAAGGPGGESASPAPAENGG